MKTILLRTLGIALLVCGYEGLANYAGWPNPLGIFCALQTEWNAHVLPHDIEVSCARWMLGWVPGAAIGIAIGLVTGRVSAIRSLLEPARLLLRALPFIGLVPIVTRLYGTSEMGKRLLIWWIACSVCWPIVDSAARSVPANIMWRASTLGASRIDRGKLVWAHCEEAVYSALRTSLSLAWILVALVEMVGVYQRSAGTFWSEGLGYRLFRAQEEGQDGLLIGVLLVFAAIGGIAEILLRSVWRSSQNLSLYFRKRKATSIISALAQHRDKSARPWQKAGELEIRGLSAGYKGKEVFTGCSLDVSSGETLAVLGQSGAGKTTLLRAIAGLYGNDLQIKGSVLLDRLPVQLDQRIGIVFQEALVFSHMTVWENVLFGRKARMNPQHG
jgi:ABC-type nitrate/sulfonate/bicarbonate transport system permease component